jgi:hypothetical protein
MISVSGIIIIMQFFQEWASRLRGAGQQANNEEKGTEYYDDIK